MSAGTVILGISAGTGHDSGAALLVDNTLVAACEEERISRIKHDGGFPSRSIAYCLNAARVTPEDVSHVAVGLHPWAAPWRRLGFLTDMGLSSHLARKAMFLRREALGLFRIGNELRRQFPRARVVFVEHHLAHAASAFFCSPFEEAAVLTMDGHGEWATGLVGHGQGSHLDKLAEAFFPESLGLVYLAFTHYLGFDTHDEYKVMGLSAYGEPEYLEIVRRIIRFDPGRIYRVDLSWIQHPAYTACPWGRHYYSDKLTKIFGPARQPGATVSTLHKNLAKSLQVALEEVGVAIARHLRARTKSGKLVLAGGVCLNGLMNYAIKASGAFENIFVQPASNDGGIALGAALHVNHQVLGNPRSFVMQHAYWGPGFSEEEIRRELETCRLPYVRLADPARVAAELIAGNHIIGWFQGRSELGPRALGNRSILADPRDPKNKDRVNARIKFREEFRPFAPSVLAEHASAYFDGLNESSYMLMICPVCPEMRSVIPAVVHVDGTARPQTVNRDTNPRYYVLIEHFHRITGVPVVLNTSFNVKGEPLVNSPTDAIRCFFSTGLDYLVMGDCLLYKGPLPDNILKTVSS